MLDLRTLILAAQQGDKEAFNQVVLRFQDMAYATAYAMVRDAALAQDAAQEAFIDAYLTLSNLREPAAFPGWFRRIVVKHSDRQTRGQRTQTIPIDELFDLRSALPNPALALDNALLQQEIHSAIDWLTPAQRLVTLLFYIEGYSLQEIAAYLELPMTAVKKRLFNARQNLKQRMMTMTEPTFQAHRPSQNEQFADNVDFIIALQTEDLAQIKKLLARNPALANLVADWKTDQHGHYWPHHEPVLYWAAGIGNRAIIELLLTHGADINAQVKENDFTPLHAAVHMTQHATVAFLLARGADVNRPGDRGQTPLHLTVHANAPAMAQKLLAADANVDMRDSYQRTPLDWALLYDRPALIALLQPPTVDAIPVHDASTALSSLPTTPRTVPVGEKLLGLLLDHTGASLEKDSPLPTDIPLRPVYQPALTAQPPILRTGIKIIDLFAPLQRGGHNALFSPLTNVGKMVMLAQLVYRMADLHNGYTVYLGLERGLYTARTMMLYWRDFMGDHQLLRERIVNLFGDIQDRPEQKLQLAETGLTIAEAFRQQGREVLLLVEAELAMSEGIMAYLRANLTTTPAAAVTALYWGDYTAGSEPKPLDALDTVVTLDRWRAEQRLYPAIDPVHSRSALLTTGAMGTEQTALAQEIQRLFRRYADLEAIYTQRGEDGLAGLADKQALHDVRAARRLHRFLTQPFSGVEIYSGQLGVNVSLADTMAGCRAILSGALNDLPEDAFYMAGTLEQVRQRA